MSEHAAEDLECVEVVITAESAEWLADFTRQLVEDRLVACGHNIAPIRAIYRWEGKVYDETQARVGLHTRASLVPVIVARTDRDHSDDVPCVIALPISTGNVDYLSWIYHETSSASQLMSTSTRQGEAPDEHLMLASEVLSWAAKCARLAALPSTASRAERDPLAHQVLDEFKVLADRLDRYDFQALLPDVAYEEEERLHAADERDDLPAVANSLWRIALAVIAASAGGPIGAAFVGDPVGREFLKSIATAFGAAAAVEGISVYENLSVRRGSESEARATTSQSLPSRPVDRRRSRPGGSMQGRLQEMRARDRRNPKPPGTSR